MSDSLAHPLAGSTALVASLWQAPSQACRRSLTHVGRSAGSFSMGGSPAPGGFYASQSAGSSDPAAARGPVMLLCLPDSCSPEMPDACLSPCNLRCRQHGRQPCARRHLRFPSSGQHSARSSRGPLCEPLWHCHAWHTDAQHTSQSGRQAQKVRKMRERIMLSLQQVTCLCGWELH